MSETPEDMQNIEAWAEVGGLMLSLVPFDLRTKVLSVALERQCAEEKQRERNPIRLIGFDENWMDTPYIRNRGTIMRLLSLVAQVFIRHITNNHSHEDAEEILYSRHPYGHGSRLLEDYVKRNH